MISCRSGASSKLVDNLRDGLHVEYENHVELETAILELLNDSATRKKMGDAGYKKVKSNYAWPRIVDEIEKIYKRA